MEYEQYSDEELIQMMTENDEIMDYLCEKYRSIVSHRAYPLFIIGGDRDDLQQEGMIGLFKAIVSYDGSKGASFKTFAITCIDRQMYTAIEKSRRKKNVPLNSYISFSQQEEEGRGTLAEVLPDYVNQDPQEEYARQVAVNDLIQQVRELLSPMEQKIYDCLLEEETPDQIARRLKRSRKSVENAINRIRVKGKRAVETLGN